MAFTTTVEKLLAQAQRSSSKHVRAVNSLEQLTASQLAAGCTRRHANRRRRREAVAAHLAGGFDLRAKSSAGRPGQTRTRARGWDFDRIYSIMCELEH